MRTIEQPPEPDPDPRELRRREEQKRKRLEQEEARKVGTEIVRQLRAKRAKP